MTDGSGRAVQTGPFLAFLAAGAVFVLASSQALPAMVASHFNADGVADGAMPRMPYTVFMLVMVVLVPAFVGLMPVRAFRSPGARINLPHADFWLAPERRDATVAVVSREVLRFATLLLAFLCYAHGLVLLANRATPPALPMAWFGGGLAVFVVAALAWTLGLLARFRRPPR